MINGKMEPSLIEGGQVKALSIGFLADLVEDWRAHGKKVFSVLREKHPQAYFGGLVALSKVIKWDAETEMFDKTLSPEEIMERISDRMNERRWNLFIACVFSTIGLVIAGMTMGTWWALVGMSIAAMGFYGSKGPFFAMPPMFLSGAGLAAGIAWINSIGNLGGFFGPWYVGVMKDLTGSYAGGLYGLALLGLVAAIVCALFLHIPSRTSSAAAPPIGAAAG